MILKLSKNLFLKILISGILNTGEVVNLFNGEDMAVMMEALSKPAQEASVNAGSASVNVQLFCWSSSNQFASCLVFVPHWRGISHTPSNVSFLGELLYYRLVY